MIVAALGVSSGARTRARARGRAASLISPGKRGHGDGSRQTLERRVCFSAAGPVVTDAQFVFDAFPTRQTVTLAFNEPVADGLREAGVTLRNLSTNAAVQSNVFGIDVDAAGDVASIRFDGSVPFHALPDGNYRLTLAAGSVSDAAGNPLAADFTFDFFAFGADANRDRAVDLTDFATLAANFNKEGRTFSQGDFSYDGKVDLTDFTVLAANFNAKLPAPTSTTMAVARATAAPPAAPQNGSVFTDAPLIGMDANSAGDRLGGLV